MIQYLQWIRLIIKVQQQKKVKQQILMWKSKSDIEVKISNLQQQTVSLKNVSFQLRDQYRQKFKKTIEQPIGLYEQLCCNKLPQKCIIHGMGYALYCLTDNKLICSRCMYQNNSHKNHSVKPMNQCLSNISSDVQKSMKQLKQIEKNIQQMRQYVEGQIFMIERQFPDAKQKILSIFKNLHQCLFDQQKWCMKHLRQYKVIMIQQRNLISKQLKNTNLYIKQTISKYQGKNSVEQVLTKKSIIDALINIPQVIQDFKIDINSNQSKFKFNEKIQQEVTNFLKQKFMDLLPWCKQKKQNQTNRQKSSKSKKQKTKSNKKNQKKLNQTTKKLQTRVQTRVQKSINKSKQTQKSLNNSKQKKQKKQLKALNLTLSPVSSTKNRSNKSNLQSPLERRSHLMTKNSLLKKEQEKDINMNKNQ